MAEGPRVVLVTGTDHYNTVDRFATERDALRASLDLVAGEDDFEGSEPEAAAGAVQAARTPPMFGGARLVTLRHGISEDTIPALIEYCAEPSGTTTLLLLHVRSGRPTKAYKELEAAIEGAGGAVLQESAPPPRTADLAAYISDAAASHGVEVDRQAATYLAEHLGPDAGTIDTVAAQLAVVQPSGGRLGVGAVAEIVGGPALAKTWDLTDAIDAGDAATALRRLEGLVIDMHPMQVHSAVLKYVRQLLAAAELQPASAKDVEVEFGIKPYPAKKIYTKVRRLPPRAFVAAHRAVTRSDVAMRGSAGLDQRTVLEILVVRLAAILGGKGQGRIRPRPGPGGVAR